MRNRRALAGHLRHQPDEQHAFYRERLRGAYERELRCRKCGGFWTITSIQDSQRKRCPACEALRTNVGKAAYERSAPAPVASAVSRRVQWVPGDDLYRQTVEAITAGERVRSILQRLAISYKVFYAIASHALGDAYRERVLSRKALVARVNIAKAHANYRGMSADERASYIEAKFGGTHALENAFAGQIADLGCSFDMNVWQSVPIDGEMVPREADLKLSLGDGRKVVILCDGEAFHGPRAVFRDAAERVRDDIVTAEAYFSLGYTVVRYSESEIRTGTARQHLISLLDRLRTAGVQRVLRTWHPPQERLVA